MNGAVDGMRKQLLSYQVILLGISMCGVMTDTRFGHALAVQGGAEAGRIEGRFETQRSALARPAVVTNLESTMAPAEAAKISLKIDGFRLEGSSVFSNEDVAGFYEHLIGRTVTLDQVFAVARQISSHYGKQGYMLSRVVVPPQALDPKGSSITLRAVEGFVDDVVWPEGLSGYHDLFSAYEEKIKASRPLNVQEFYRYVMLASDLPGFKFRTNFTASDTNPGASTLVVTVDKDPYDTSVSIDNRGSEGSGPVQATVSGSLNNMLGWHERLSGGYTIAGPSRNSANPELHYIFFGYSQVLNSEGLTFSLNGNASWGDPDSEVLSALDYETEGLNLSAALAYPFIRSRDHNLTGTVAFDFKNSESTNATGVASKDRLRIFRGELAWDRADSLKGTNQAIVTVSKGINGLGSTDNGNPDASRTPGKVDFFKVEASLSRSQNLAHSFSLFAQVKGQWTNDPLLSSQECGFGGAQDGRGFDSSIITGDKCLIGQAELRYDMPLSQLKLDSILDYSQLYGFIDYGRIWNIDAPLGTADQDDAASIGLGIRLAKDKISADFMVSHTLEEPDSTGDQDDVRGWFRISAHF